MDALRTVIERLEKATGPDSYLDCNIREAVEGWRNVGGGWREWPDGRRERYDYGYAPRYTESIDAALTLVPEGCGLLMATGRYCKATVSIGYLGDMDAKWIGDAKAPTLPLALCRAALEAAARARAEKPAR